jgi:hypothetical protein
VRRAAALLALIALSLGACSPKAQTSQYHMINSLLLPDCSLGFEKLKAKITSQPGLVQAPKDPAEPYEWYTSADQATSYVITEPGAPGHPAILVQHAANGNELTDGCPYGDKKGYQQVLAYVESLKGAHK